MHAELSQFRSRLRSEYWAMEPRALQALVDSVERIDDAQAADAVRTQQTQRLPMRTDGPLAVINIHGPIVHSQSIFDRIISRVFLGATEIDDIAAAVQAAADDSAVQAVAFHVASPGGVVSRIHTTAGLIGSIPKPTAAFMEMGASAAYWLGGMADAVYARPDSLIGSIGVFGTLLDASGAYSAAGLKVHMISSGKLKGSHEGVAPTPAQLDAQQTIVNDIFALFMGDIRRRRHNLAASVTDGGLYLGEKAKAAGLVDHIVASLPDFLSRFAGDSYVAMSDAVSEWQRLGDAAIRAGRASISGRNNVMNQQQQNYFGESPQTAPTPTVDALKAEYNASAALQREFSSAETYAAYKRAESAGRCRISGPGRPPQ